jgi:hypothetical protein
MAVILDFFADSFSARAKVRASLAVDKAWQEEYFQKILPMLQSQENMTLSRYFPLIEQEQRTRHGRRNTSRRFPCFSHKRT